LGGTLTGVGLLWGSLAAIFLLLGLALLCRRSNRL